MPISARFALFPLVLSAALIAAPTQAHSAAVDDPGANAAAVMAQVKRQAASSHKNILLSFGASWCVNCRLFDKFLADPAIHPIMEKAFIYADLNTGERDGDTRHSNIPAARNCRHLWEARIPATPTLSCSIHPANPSSTRSNPATTDIPATSVTQPRPTKSIGSWKCSGRPRLHLPQKTPQPSAPG